MNILDEMRAEAAVMSDSDVAAIMEIAFRGMQKDRWSKLRKRMVIPTDEKEQAYVHALNMYVKAKLDLRRARNFHLYGKREFLERERTRWRAEMDRIEFDLSPSLVEELMHRLSFFRLKDDVAEIGFSASPYSRPEIDSLHFVKNPRLEGVIFKDPAPPIPYVESSMVKQLSRFDEEVVISAMKGKLVKPLSSAKVVPATTGTTTPSILRCNGWIDYAVTGG